MRLKGKRVLVTGGGGGLGTLICQRLIKLQAEVTVIDRVETLSFDANLIRGDLSTAEGIADVVRQVDPLEWDVLVNLAGLQYFGPFERQTPEHLVNTYMVNLVAPAMLAQSVGHGMRWRGHGCIVNIGSVFGSINFAHFATYSSSKAGLRGLSQALRREYAGSGVKVVYIAPRAVRTPLNSAQVMEFARRTHMNMDDPEYVARRIVKAIRHRNREVYIGFPESLFVRINAVAPGLVDSALAKNDRRASELFAE